MVVVAVVVVVFHCCCHCSVPDSDTDTVTVTGTPEAIEAAERAINDIVNEQKEKQQKYAEYVDGDVAAAETDKLYKQYQDEVNEHAKKRSEVFCLPSLIRFSLSLFFSSSSLSISFLLLRSCRFVFADASLPLRLTSPF